MDQVRSTPEDALATVADAYFALDAEWRFTDLDTAAEEHFGRPARELIGRNVWDETGRGDSALCVAFQEAATHRRRMRLEVESRVRAGCWFEVHLNPRHDGGLDVYFHDVTDRKRTEAALRETEERFRQLTEASFEALVIHANGLVLDVNSRVAEMFGYRPADVVGKKFWAFIPPEYHALVRDQFESAAERPYQVEILHAGGRRVPVEVMGRPITWRGAPARAAALRDITERKRAEDALRASERRERERAVELQTILDTAPIGVAIAADARGHHIRGNRANEEMFGLPHGGELSKAGPRPARFRVVQDGRELAPAELPMQRAVRGETVDEQVFDVVREDGRTLTVYAKATPLFDEGGRPRGAVGAFLDITRRQRAEEGLRSANAALAEADRRKDEFIAILSHELRNPLAPIRYALPLLSEERLGEKGRRAVAVIDRQVAHLTRLVDDLLDISRITTGKIELRPDRVALSAVLSAAVEAASPAIAAARHSLDVAVPDAPIWLNVDAARIAQAVTNLLNNSAKYTPKGGRIRLEATVADDQVVIRIVDNGIGIAPNALPTVFEMFRHGDGGHKSQGGLGIGLSLARQLVEMHNGTIEAHSAGENKGAEFVIRLPPAAAGSEPAEQPAAKPYGGAPCLRVLVVDDNVDLVDMLALVVEAAGHQTRKAFDGPSAISAALDYRPHVILLDVGMPGMNGIEVATELRRHAAMRSTIIVALTGWGQAEDRRVTAEAGFDDHLTKPTDPRQIQRVLADVARRVSATESGAGG